VRAKTTGSAATDAGVTASRTCETCDAATVSTTERAGEAHCAIASTTKDGAGETCGASETRRTREAGIPVANRTKGGVACESHKSRAGLDCTQGPTQGH
jgi:hypothetical protein